MTASLQATAMLAADPLFTSRVQAAMISAALDVATETPGTSYAVYGARHSLAIAILQGAPLPGGRVPFPASGPWLDQFVWAVASNPVIAGAVSDPVQVASSTSGPDSIIVTTQPHGLTTGDWAEITGHLVNTAVNGVWPVIVIDGSTFKIPTIGADTGADTGQVTHQPPDGDIQFTVDSVFGSIAGVGVIT
jgi:hypothetical protein